MELDQLKANWQELSKKMENSEIFNRKVTINMLKRKADSSIGKLERFEYFFLVLSVILAGLYSTLLAINEERAFKNESIMVIIAVFVIAGIWQGYKIYLLGKIKYDSCTTIDLLKRASEFKLMTQARFVVGMVLLIPTIILLVNFQRDMLTREMIVGMVVGGTFGLLIGIRAFLMHWKNIDELIYDLKEIKSYEKD
jgi:RsiW-degrading membrane proteinase PrsW (M82 family)